jgi:hypothetical protein
MQADDDVAASSSSSFALASWSIASLFFYYFGFFLVFLLTNPVEHLLVDASTRLLQLTKMGRLMDGRFHYLTLERSQLLNAPKKEAKFSHSRVDRLVAKRLMNRSRQDGSQQGRALLFLVSKQSLTTLSS